MMSQGKTTEKREAEVLRRKQTPASHHDDGGETEPDTTELKHTVANPSEARPNAIVWLQRRYGNRAVTRLLQRKLTVSAAHDQYEQEADRVADQIVSSQPPAAGGQPAVQRAGKAEEDELHKKPLAGSISRLVQRAAKPEEEEEQKPVQTQRVAAEESFETNSDFENRVNASRGSGSPLPGETREFMESRFGADFSGVRIHRDSQSAQLNREVSAQAFTQGQDIFLGEGKSDLASSEGKHLLAHELTHVVQQTGATQRTTQDQDEA